MINDDEIKKVYGVDPKETCIRYRNHFIDKNNNLAVVSRDGGDNDFYDFDKTDYPNFIESVNEDTYRTYYFGQLANH